MKRTLLANAVLLVVGLGLALSVWLGEETSQRASIKLLDLASDQIRAVAYSWPDGSLQLTPRGSGKQLRMDAILNTLEQPPVQPTSAPSSRPAPDAGLLDDAGTRADSGQDTATRNSADKTPTAEPVRRTATFPAGDSVLRAIDKLTPLEALRDLGSIPDERLAKVGLISPRRVLVITTTTGEHRLEIGEKTYGAEGRYARLAGESAIYLVTNSLVTGLEGTAERLMEWRLVPHDLEQVAGFDLAIAGQSKSFHQVDRDQPTRARFVAPGQPDLAIDAAMEVFKQLRGLRALRYFDQPPAPGTTAEAVAFTVHLGEAEPLVVVLYENSDGSGYLVKAGRWLAEVGTPQARQLVEDATALLPTE